jgi:hypothetical protein
MNYPATLKAMAAPGMHANAIKLNAETYRGKSTIPINKMIGDVVRGFYSGTGDNVLSRMKNAIPGTGDPRSGEAAQFYGPIQSMVYDDRTDDITIVYTPGVDGNAIKGAEKVNTDSWADDWVDDAGAAAGPVGTLIISCPSSKPGVRDDGTPVVAFLPREHAFLFEQYVAYRLCQVLGDLAFGKWLQTSDLLELVTNVEEGMSRVLISLQTVHEEINPYKAVVLPDGGPKFTNTSRYAQLLFFIEEAKLQDGLVALPKENWLFDQVPAPTNHRQIWKDYLDLLAKRREDQGRVAVYCRIMGSRDKTGNPQNIVSSGSKSGYLIDTTCVLGPNNIKYGPFKNVFVGQDIDRQTECNDAFLKGEGAAFMPDLAPVSRTFLDVGYLWGPDVRSPAGDIVEKLKAGSPVVLFGYGNSGSGKSYSLFGSKTLKTDGVVQKVLNNFGSDFKVVLVFEEYVGTVKDCKVKGLTNATMKNQSLPANALDDIACSLHGTILLLYGNDGEKKSLEGLNIIDLRNTAKLTPPDKSNPLRSFLDQVLTLRTNQMRIRATVNNPESSRSHLYIVFKNNNNVKFVVADLGGIESPFHMIDQYHTKIAAAAATTANKLKHASGNTVWNDQYNNLTKTLTLLTGDTVGVNKEERKSYASDKGMRNFVTVQPMLSLMVSVLRHALKEKEKEEKTVLMTDFLAAYTQYAANPLMTVKKPMDAITYSIEQFKQNGFATRLSPEVCKPKLQKSLDENNNVDLIKHVGKPTTEYEGPDYFNLFHIACLFVEGMYIRASLEQIRDMCLSSAGASPNTGAGATAAGTGTGGALTKRVITALTAGVQKPALVMMYTLKTGDAIDAQTAAIAHDIASTTVGQPIYHTNTNNACPLP